ncbi:MAG: hypothetical protein JWO86_5462 [Myxococcaceae bacterium]|nr:hypothetical protein [Myxococcaceae bacterium]
MKSVIARASTSAVAGIALAAALSPLGCNANDTSPVTPTGTVTAGSGPGDLGAGDPGPGGVRFAASGEVLALTGYGFPPASADDPAFVDGWEVRFTHLLTTVDNVTLYDNPDTSPGDQSLTGGIVVQLKGPWAVDLARSDPSYLPGKGSPGELAVPFASVSEGNDGNALKTDGTRYGFGYDLVAATSGARMVNVIGDAVTDYAEMVKNGCTVLYVGTATFKGDKADPACFPPDRQGWPEVVNFRLCFQSPTTYLNCQNPDNDPARPFGGEEHQRGIALKEGSSVIAQITLHTDHPFWDSVIHDSPTHFDQLAARVVGQPAGTTPTVTLEDMRGVDYTAVTDANGNALQWRYCLAPRTDAHAKFVGAMSFDPQSVPHAVGGNPATGLRDLYDFATYDQSTQGHLDADGLCFVRRSYPSPP